MIVNIKELGFSNNHGIIPYLIKIFYKKRILKIEKDKLHFMQFPWDVEVSVKENYFLVNNHRTSPFYYNL